MLTKRHLAPRCRRLAVPLALLATAACGAQDRLEPVYCYRTLADVSCYAAPDRGRENQLAGVYLRDPDAAAASQAEAASGPPPDDDGPGSVRRWLVASVDFLGWILTPVAPVVGLFRGP